MKKQNVFFDIAVFIGLALNGHALPADPVVRYDVIPLQAPPGTNANDGNSYNPIAINNKGEAVGSALLLGKQRQFYAAFWDAQGELHDFGTTAPNIQYHAQSINDKEQIVGSAVTRKSDAVFPFLAQDGRVVSLKTLPGFAEFIAQGRALEAFNGGEAINNTGQILFHVKVQTPAKRIQDLRVGPQAVLYDNRHFQELDPLPNGNYVRAYGLNNAGMIVGGSTTSSLPMGNVSHGFLWQNGHMTDLGVPAGFDGSDARAANAQGQVVGTMWRKNENSSDAIPYERVQAYFWDHGVTQRLGTLPGCAYTLPTGVNSSGQVVGNSYNIQKENDPTLGVMYSQTGAANGSDVFLWQNGKMQDLQKLVPTDWNLYSAVGINDRGEILCTGYHAGMPSRALGGGAFILRPRR